MLNDKNDIPAGPTVATSTGKVSQNATFQDLLKTPKDETNFENLATSELAKVDLNGSISNFAKGAMYAGKSFSPDGNYIMVTTIKRPFSYIVPLSRFPSETIILDKSGNTVKTVSETPLNEVMPKGFSSVRIGKRAIGWRDDMPSTLYYVEALDGGDQAKKVEYRDQIYTWDAPFNTEAKSLFKTKDRFAGIEWGNADNAFVSESWYDTRKVKTNWIDPKTGDSKVIVDRNFQDVYSNPGSLLTERNQYGRNVVEIKDNKTYWIGDGFTKEDSSRSLMKWI